MNPTNESETFAAPARGATNERPKTTASGPIDREEGLNVTVEANTLSNNPYSESNWVSTQQLPSMPLATTTVGTLMPSPLVEAAQTNVVEERIVTEVAGDKVYRETTTIEMSRDGGVSTHTGYWASTQGGTYTSGGQGGYTSGYSTAAAAAAGGSLGGTYVSSLYPSHGGTQSTSQGMETSLNLQGGGVSVVPHQGGVLNPISSQGWQTSKQQMATLEVSPLPSTTNVVTTTTTTMQPINTGSAVVQVIRGDVGGGVSYREETIQSGRRDTETVYTTGDVRNFSGVGEQSRHTDGSYIQSFATLRDNAFHSSGWATNAVDSRVASRMSSAVMSTVTYPPHPDQTVICWPPRVVHQTQGAFVTNADVERWKSYTANTQAENVQVIEVEVLQEKVIHKPVIRHEEKIREVKKEVIQWVDKVVQEPVIEWREVPQYVDQEVWVEKKVRKKEIVDKYVDKIIEVKKRVPVVKEVVREIPLPTERPVPVPTPYHLKSLKVRDVEKPTVVAQILKSTLRETEEVAEVPLKEFVPELVPVVIQIPKPVSIQVWLGGVISTVHRQTTVTAAHWNSLVKLANASVTYTEILPYMRDVNTNFIPFLPVTERVEWVEPISQEWRLTGWSHVNVPDGYVIRSLEVIIAEFNEAREAEYREAKIKLAATNATSAHEMTTSLTQSGPEIVTQIHTARGTTSGLLAGSVTGPALNSSTSGFNYSFATAAASNYPVSNLQTTNFPVANMQTTNFPVVASLQPTTFQSANFGTSSFQAAHIQGGTSLHSGFQSEFQSLPQTMTKTMTTLNGRSLGRLAGTSSKPSILLSDLPVTRELNMSARDPGTLPGTFINGDL